MLYSTYCCCCCCFNATYIVAFCTQQHRHFIVVIAVIVIDAYVDIIIVIVVGPINVAAVRSKRSKCTQDKRTANAIAARQKMPNCPETATLNDKSKKKRTQPSAQLNTGLHLRVARPKHFPHHPANTARLRRVVAVMEAWVPP